MSDHVGSSMNCISACMNRIIALQIVMHKGSVEGISGSERAQHMNVFRRNFSDAVCCDDIYGTRTVSCDDGSSGTA